MEHALKSRRPLAVSRNKRRPPAPESAVAGSPWQLQAAKAKFSEVVEKARGVGPQTITKNGLSTAVVVSVEEWERKSARSGSLAEFLLASPLRGADLDIERSQDDARAHDL